MKTVGFSSASLPAGVWNDGNGIPQKPFNSFVRRPDILKRPPPMRSSSSSNSLVASPSSSAVFNMDKLSQNSCPHCPYVAACRANLLVHMRSHTGERPYACGLCDASFTISSNLKRHQRARHYDHFLLTTLQDGAAVMHERKMVGGDEAPSVGEQDQHGVLTSDQQQASWKGSSHET